MPVKLEFALNLYHTSPIHNVLMKIMLARNTKWDIKNSHKDMELGDRYLIFKICIRHLNQFRN